MKIGILIQNLVRKSIRLEQKISEFCPKLSVFSPNINKLALHISEVVLHSSDSSLSRTNPLGLNYRRNIRDISELYCHGL